MSKKISGRSKLRSLFSAGNLPTQDDFSLLIGSQHNLKDDQFQRKDDGISGSSLAIGAGKDGGLLSFFEDIENPMADWSLKINPHNRDLELLTNNQHSPLLYFSQSGHVGIGTDSPDYTLDVEGDIRGKGLTIDQQIDTSDLKVSGTAVMERLIVNGQELNDLIDALLQNGHTPDDTPSDGGGGGDPPPENETGGSTDPDCNPLDKITPAFDATGGIDIPADGRWHAILTQLEGFQNYAMLGYVSEKGNHAITYAIGVNVMGDPSSCAIHATQSYMGSPKSKVDFRWSRIGNSPNKFCLQARTRLRFKKDTVIHCFLKNLMP